jgi:hypothetical protein
MVISIRPCASGRASTCTYGVDSVKTNHCNKLNPSCLTAPLVVAPWKMYENTSILILNLHVAATCLRLFRDHRLAAFLTDWCPVVFDIRVSFIINIIKAMSKLYMYNMRLHTASAYNKFNIILYCCRFSIHAQYNFTRNLTNLLTSCFLVKASI